MTEHEFSDGYLLYQVDSCVASEAVALKAGGLSTWSGGFMAFSRGELVLSDAVKSLDLADLLVRKANGIPGVEGYLMEVDLWRRLEDGIAEEICIERDDDGFVVQSWSLFGEDHAKVPTAALPCYYREAATFPYKNSIFKNQLSSIEVIAPEKRLHFFLTQGGR